MSKGTEKSGGTDTTHSSPNLKFSTYDTSRVYSVFIHTYLLAPFTLVRLLSTMDTLVSLKVVALNKPHITHVTSKWLLS